MASVLVATTKIHLNDDRYVQPGHPLPDDVDQNAPELAELLRSGALVDPAAMVAQDDDLPQYVKDALRHGEGTRVLGMALVEKYNGNDADARAIDPAVDADEVIVGTPNLLTIGGASALLQCLIGNGTTTAGQALTYFNNSNAYIGVGDSTTAAADTQTDLQAATNKLRKAMVATYPQHTDSTSSTGAKSIVFQGNFATTDANWTWNEWALFNGSSGGRMLNRKVEALGTKTSANAWIITVTYALA